MAAAARIRDPEVLVLQRRLKELGLYAGELDGDFGPKTLTAALKGVESLPIIVPAAPPDVETAAPAKTDGAFERAMPLIKEFEGFRSAAYWDATGKVWTIGYGTTVYPGGKPVKQGDVHTKDECLEFLRHDVSTIRVPAIRSKLKVSQNDNQLAALISFVYNVGVGAFGGSTLLKKINAGASKAECAKQFAAWNKSGGKVLAGLTRRRKAEAALYVS